MCFLENKTENIDSANLIFGIIFFVKFILVSKKGNKEITLGKRNMHYNIKLCQKYQYLSQYLMKISCI